MTDWVRSDIRRYITRLFRDYDRITMDFVVSTVFDSLNKKFVNAPTEVVKDEILSYVQDGILEMSTDGYKNTWLVRTDKFPKGFVRYISNA